MNAALTTQFISCKWSRQTAVDAAVKLKFSLLFELEIFSQQMSENVETLSRDRSSLHYITYQNWHLSIQNKIFFPVKNQEFLRYQL